MTDQEQLNEPEWPTQLQIYSARIRELEAVVRFCRDIAEEEYAFQKNNVGAECALRHIIRKTNEVYKVRP